MDWRKSYRIPTMDETHEYIEQRREEVEAHNRAGREWETMRQLAETDMDEAAELLARSERTTDREGTPRKSG